jgi:Tol biopolymer transport system component
VRNVGEAYDWSPQGDQVAYTYGGSSFVARRDGKPVSSFSDLDAFDVNWSPDAQELAMSVNDDPIGGRHVAIYVIDLDKGKPRGIAGEEGSTAYLDWRPLQP